MNQPAKAQEPSMEEILASIRRIIADDDAVKPKAAEAPKPAPAPPPRPAAVAPPPPAPTPPAGAANSQDDIDAMFAGFDSEPEPEPAPAPPPVAEEPPASDILELTEAMEAPEAPSFRRIDGGPDVVFREPAPEPPPPPPPPPSTVDHARRSFELHTEVDRSLLSPTTSAAVDSAFNSLANTVLVQNARTLDDLVREMLRPMLKAWLDDNLPNMVERMVRAEIERVSRGRG